MGMNVLSKPRGRPALKQGAGKAVVVQTCMTPEQRDKLNRLGGAQWVRAKIDKAREVNHGNV